MEEDDIFKRENRNKTPQGDKAVETKIFPKPLASTSKAVVSASIAILPFCIFMLAKKKHVL